jgi:maltose alpha-D-glucosyltransferase/alpha-amylase
MLLSFNYATHAAFVPVSANSPEDLARFERLLRDWEAEVGRVFLAAYYEAVNSSEPLATQASPHGLLELFLLEKALYEVRYELENRPDWVGIPLLGILSLLQADIRQ